MNREILFRGKTEPDGHWVYGSLISRRVFFGWLHWINHQELVDKTNKLWSDCEARVKSETVGQYTGLKDKNGVEIFEGDICKYRYGRWTYIGKVAFNTHACIFEMRRTEMVGSHGERAIKTQLLNHIDKVEVIGTIHDNPELLGV